MSTNSLPVSLRLFGEITNEALRFDSRTASSSRQDGFVFLYFLFKEWLPEFNLSYSLVISKDFVE